MSGWTITETPQAISAQTPQVNTWVSAEACKQSTLDVNFQTLFLEEKTGRLVYSAPHGYAQFLTTGMQCERQKMRG